MKHLLKNLFLKTLGTALSLLWLVASIQHVHAIDIPALLDKLPPSKPRPIDDGFTLIIATYKRNELLERLLAYLTRRPPQSLRHILVVWQNVGESIPHWLEPESLTSSSTLIKNHQLDVHVRVSKKNSMNERFRPLLDWEIELPTEDVMIMDDDLVLPWSTLEWGYQRFKENPGRIVGFSGRDYATPENNQDLLDENGEMRELKPGEIGLYYNAQPYRQYSMVLSNAAWMKRKWLQKYWEEEDQVLKKEREYIDDVFNCDDILINFIVSNMTRQPPLLLQTPIPLRSIPSKGLWNRDVPDKPTAAATTRIASSPSAARSSPEPIHSQVPHFLQRQICLDRYFTLFSTYDPNPSHPSLPPTYYPLLRADYSITKDVEDRSRPLKEGEVWDEPGWAVGDVDDAEESEEKRRLDEYLSGLSESELEEFMGKMDDDEQDWDVSEGRSVVGENGKERLRDEL